MWIRRSPSRGGAKRLLGLLLLLILAASAPAVAAQREIAPGPSAVQAVYDTRGLLRVGTPAPWFTLPRADGAAVRLEELLGRPLVLYFYPMDDTPGCTKEACAFRDDYAAFDSLGIRIVGISTDDPASHLAFSEKYRLPFLLLSDTDGTVCSLYGVAVARERQGEKRTVARRVTYLLDSKGMVLHVYDRVDPVGHSAEILAALPRLLASPRPVNPKATDPPPPPEGR